MKVAFTGDVFLGGDLSSEEFSNISNVINSNFYSNADIRIANLEQAISDGHYIENKSTLYSDNNSILRLKVMGINVVNLANNHIHDKTDQGIIDTIESLDKNEVYHVGAGKNINEARKPFWLNDELCMLGYCEYDKPYLMQIMVAGEQNPGIAPLRYDEIIKDLNMLPPNVRVVLYFHWGREHVFFPPFNDILLAKKLLDHNKVALIIGTHAHRIQGFIEHNNKRAYMSIGNFLFPNFVFNPPVQIANGSSKDTQMDITRRYHRVFRPTYKKWNNINRLSLVIMHDSETGGLQHSFLYQKDNAPIVYELSVFKQSLLNIFLSILSSLYKMPSILYKIVEFLNDKIFYSIWFFKIAVFMFKQSVQVFGLKYAFTEVIKRISSRR